MLLEALDVEVVRRQQLDRRALKCQRVAGEEQPRESERQADDDGEPGRVVATRTTRDSDASVGG